MALKVVIRSLFNRELQLFQLVMLQTTYMCTATWKFGIFKTFLLLKFMREQY